MMVHIGPGQVFSSFGGNAPGYLKIGNSGAKFWPFDGEHLENVKSQQYMSIRAERELSKNVSHGVSSPQGRLL